MSVEAAVERELVRLGGRWRDSVHGATALALAAELDDGANSATSKSMVAKALNETMAELRALCPPSVEVDRIDEVNRKREQRKSRSGSAEA